MSSGYFSEIPSIKYKGPDSKDPMSYRWYDQNRMVLGKTMAEHLRIAVCYWHTFCSGGADMFGVNTFDRAWQNGADPIKLAEMKLDVAFEFVSKLGVPFYTFHDRDIAPELGSLKESQKAYGHIIDKAAEAQERTGIKLLWGTANLFSHPRYMAGAATNPNPEVFACAAAQVRDAMEATKKLGGSGYVLWGGREGYDTLLNTDLRKELDQLGRFLSLVVEHKHKIGFSGSILLEPKPMEPTKHQYDHDVATVYGFLCRYGLEKEIGVNIECNHATLAGHSFEHEVATALALGIFGSVDANRGDAQNGWDTDQFPNDVPETALALYHILQAGGLKKGGFNFDAKVRRQSVDTADLFHAHIGGIDTLARGLLIAEQLIVDQALKAPLDSRYADWGGAFGESILNKTATLASLADYAISKDLDPKPRSGRQEALENVVARYL